jgi:hypothetical protein
MAPLDGGTCANNLRCFAGSRRSRSMKSLSPTPMARLVLAGACAAALAACGTSGGYYNDPRNVWEVDAWASARPDGLYSLRTVTVAPDTCYAPGEIRSAPSSLPETIEVQVTIERGAGPCDRYLSDIVHDLPALRVEPDDRQVEIVVFADGAVRNRAIVGLSNAPPITGPYDPRYVPPRY